MECVMCIHVCVHRRRMGEHINYIILQRIERWWLNNKQGGCQFWIDAFKDLVARGILSTADPLSM